MAEAAYDSAVAAMEANPTTNDDDETPQTYCLSAYFEAIVQKLLECDPSCKKYTSITMSK